MLTSQNQHAYLWNIGKGTQDLGTLGGNNSRANRINNSGQVVGYANTNTSNNKTHAFLWTSVGGMQEHEDPLVWSSSASDINSNGQVVGQDNSHAFLWSAAVGCRTWVHCLAEAAAKAWNQYLRGDCWHWLRQRWRVVAAFLWQWCHGLQDLNGLIPTGSGWTLQYATAINDNGWIIGSGANPRGQTHAFLLTPTPEPSTFALLGIGAFSLIAYALATAKIDGIANRPEKTLQKTSHHWGMALLLPSHNPSAISSTPHERASPSVSVQPLAVAIGVKERTMQRMTRRRTKRPETSIAYHRKARRARSFAEKP